MSAESLLKNEAQATTAEDQGLLSKVVAATRQTEPDRAQNLLRTLADQALKGTVKYDRNLTVTLNHAIAELDRTISEQLAAIMQAPEFAKLEGTWRGLNYLVKNSETSVNLKIRVMNSGKRELARDLEKAVEFDQSRLFKAIYEDEFGTPAASRSARSSATMNSTTPSMTCSCCRASRRLRRRLSHRSSRRQARICSASRITAISPVRAIWRKSSIRWNMPSGAASARATIPVS